MSTFCTGGGLGEATAWLCLRQEIYVSLVSQQPIRTKVLNFAKSTSLQKNDDTSWANRMVLLLANVLNAAFRDDAQHHDQNLQDLSDQVDGWMRDKPITFEPIKSIPRIKETANRFPVIWMLHPVHVIGLQYYHIAKIVLAASTGTPENVTRYSFTFSR